MQKVLSLLKPQGRIVGLLFDKVFEAPGPPFGGDVVTYEKLFRPFFPSTKWKSVTIVFHQEQEKRFLLIFQNLNPIMEFYESRRIRAYTGFLPYSSNRLKAYMAGNLGNFCSIRLL
ncbi:hypothetical protein [Sphingobacterium sp. IITKGP-BTPF85]|uniref:hypothetical protein n=1 Tax=Sphingobacterium sp. IITKGP-BTPF85 TaxID=1338009 RepID=UPI001E60A119|nr:hypothetical protein [Sphingobacterium sp. IITKGP-BTPF85]